MRITAGVLPSNWALGGGGTLSTLPLATPMNLRTGGRDPSLLPSFQLAAVHAPRYKFPGRLDVDTR